MVETPRLQAKQGCHSEAAPRNLSTSDQDRFGQMILLNPPYPFFRFFGLGREFGIRIRVRLDRKKDERAWVQLTVSLKGCAR